MHFTSIATTLGMLLFLSCNVFAQPTLKSETQFGLSQTLAYGGVAQDLGITPEEAAQLSGLWTQVEYKLVDKFRDYRRNFSPRFSDIEKERLTEQLMDGLKEVRQFERKQLEVVLNPSQIRRLGQIRFQLMARKGENLVNLKADLEITDQQLKSMKEVAKERTEEIRKLRSDAVAEKLTPNEVAEELQLIKEDFEGKFQDVLTGDQRQSLRRLQGKKFEVRVGRPTDKKGETTH